MAYTIYTYLIYSYIHLHKPIMHFINLLVHVIISLYLLLVETDLVL